VPCDGRALGRILAAAIASDAPLADDLDMATEGFRVPERSTSRVIRAVRLIGAHLPTLLGPLVGAASAHRPPRAPRWAEPVPRGFDNGLGGLHPDGDYEIQVAGDRVPPAPWANVVANSHGGFRGTTIRRVIR